MAWGSRAGLRARRPDGTATEAGWAGGARTKMVHEDDELLPRDLAALELGNLAFTSLHRAGHKSGPAMRSDDFSR